jgi:branched-chain amino acid transport system ATP-binding protein
LANSLTIEGIDAGYGAVRVLEDVSIRIGGGETVVLLGTNGNGKSTLMKSIMGLVRPRAGRIVAEIEGERHDLIGRSTVDIVDLGIALVPEGRRLFPRLSVEKNLRLGAYTRRDKHEIEASLEYAFGLFPVLKERRTQMAGTMSGGEQQMLAIARGLMAKPKLLLLDEPSWGIAPKLVTRILDTIQVINAAGITLLMVEQNVQRALAIAHRGYVMQTGRIVIEGTSRDLLQSATVQKAYLGM